MEQLKFDSCSGGLPVSGSRTGRERVDLLQEPRSPRGRVAARFLATVLERPEVKRLLSDDHFSLDGTLIQAWPSMKSFRPKGDPAEPPTGGRNDGRDFHDGATTTRMPRPPTPKPAVPQGGRAWRPGSAFMGDLLLENRSGLVVGPRLTQATGVAERPAAMALMRPSRACTGSRSAPDRAYDTAGLVAGLRAINARPDIAQTPQAGPRAPIAAPSAIPAIARATGAQADRGSVRLGEDDCLAAPDEVQWRRAGWLGLHARGCGLQPRRCFFGSQR
jgi:hypothetical protein